MFGHVLVCLFPRGTRSYRFDGQQVEKFRVFFSKDKRGGNEGNSRNKSTSTCRVLIDSRRGKSFRSAAETQKVYVTKRIQLRKRKITQIIQTVKVF